MGGGGPYMDGNVKCWATPADHKAVPQGNFFLKLKMYIKTLELFLDSKSKNENVQ